MPVITLEQLRANKTRDSLYVLLHKKGLYLSRQLLTNSYGRVILFRLQFIMSQSSSMRYVPLLQ